MLVGSDIDAFCMLILNYPRQISGIYILHLIMRRK
jgi:hypothetical protein